MSYFVTGATGFIGRHLVERLLEREGDIHVLVREGSREKLDALIERWDAADRIKPVAGDLTEPMLGVSEEDRKALAGVEHFFHLAAIYDMTADETQNAMLNVGGTQNAVQLANDVGAGVFQHVSSVAVAGRYKGHFTEDMFDEGQELHTPYHRTKFEAEKLVREKVQGAWRVYRPAVVVGNSKTGEMDKIDGPYYFFKALQKLRNALPAVGAAGLDRVGLDEPRPGRLRRRRDRPHRPRGGPRRAGVPHRRPQGHQGRRGDEHVRARRARPARGDAHRQEAHEHAPEGRPELRDADPGAQGRAQVRARRPRDPRRDPRGRRLHREVRRARHQARPGRLGHRAAGAGLLRLQALGLLGAQPRPGPVQGPLVRGRRQRAHGGHHGRLERHRPRRGAEDRERRRDPDPGRPLAGQARGAARRDPGHGRHRLRLLGRPLRQRLDRRRRREDPLRARRRWTCSSTTRAARSGAR